MLAVTIMGAHIAMALDGGKPGSHLDRPLGATGYQFLRPLRALVHSVTDLIVPPVCLACQSPLAVHDALCAACWRRVSFIRPPLCDQLGIPLPYDTGGRMLSGAALANPPPWDRARAVASFEHVMRELVHKLKYADRHDARRLFGRWLAEAGRELLSDSDLLIPVPLHRTRLWRRRFNQSALLCAELTRLTGVPSDPFALVRIKATPSQIGLSETERRSNTAGAFAMAFGAAARIEGKRVVLVDDVVTTGATVAACARVLRRAGAARIDVLSLALVTADGGFDQ